MTALERAWQFIHEQEGGAAITNDPADPGGLTKHGFSQRAYPTLNIRDLTEAEAKRLFERDYWRVCKCDQLPDPVAIAVADSAFNQGTGTAIRLLQAALGLDQDGIIGPATLAASKAKPAGMVVNEFLSRRLVRYSNGKDKFRRGWMMRVLRLKDALAGL